MQTQIKGQTIAQFSFSSRTYGTLDARVNKDTKLEVLILGFFNLLGFLKLFVYLEKNTYDSGSYYTFISLLATLINYGAFKN